MPKTLQSAKKLSDHEKLFQIRPTADNTFEPYLIRLLLSPLVELPLVFNEEHLYHGLKGNLRSARRGCYVIFIERPHRVNTHRC